MSDYKVLIGTELRTKDIDKQVKDYKGNVNIGVDPNGIKSGIDNALNGYKAPKPVEVQSTLNTQGITDAITKYSGKENRKKIKVGIDPDHLFDGVETIIGNKTFKTPLKVNVDLVWAGVASQIANPDFGAKGKPVFRVDVDFDDKIIETKWDSFAQGESRKRKLTVPIKPTLTGADAAEFFANVENTLKDYKAKTPLKVSVTLNKSEINKKITEYNQSLAQNSGKRILFNAALRANAIEKAITDFKTKHPDKLKIPIDFKINSELEKNAEFETALKQKIEHYESQPLDIPVRLKPASKGFKDQISKVYATVEATLSNPKAISEEINSHIQSPVPVSVKLVPAKTGFTNEITKTPIKIEAELAPEAINNAIANPPKNLSKIPIGVSLTPKDANDINSQVKQLQPFATEKLNVGVALDESTINTDISTFKPTATLKIQPDLMLENVDEQIGAYVPKVPIRVQLKVEDSNIDEKAGKPSSQEPIRVNVQLDQKSINEEIKAFDPALNSKIKVGVELDFNGHKNKDTKEYIQKSISQQIKEYQTESKVKVGVELDKDDIESQIQTIETGSPVKLGVELDMEPVKAEIEKLRNEFQKFGKIVIQFPNANNGNGNGNNRTSGGSATGANAPSGSANDFKKFTASVSNAKNVVTAMKTTLDGLGVNLKDVGAKNATKDIREMGIEVQKVVTTIKGNTLQMSVTGIQETESGIKRIVTETRKYDDAITNAENINKRFTQTFETSADAAKKLEKEVNDAFTTIYDTKKKIGNLEVELIGAKAEKDLERVKSINAEIVRLKGNLKAADKKGVYSSKFTNQQNAGLTELDKQIEYQKSYAKSKLLDARNDLVQEIRFKIDTNDFEKDVSNIEAKAKNLGNISNELRKSITQLKSNKTRMGNALDNDDIDAAIKAYERYLKLLETVNNQLGIRKNEKKFIDVDFSKLENLKSEIDSIKKKIENLDPKVNTEQLSVLSNRLKDLEVDYDDLYKKLQKDLSTSQMEELDESTAKANVELEELRGKIADIKAKLANKINAKLVNSDSGLSQFDNEIDAVTTKYNRLSKKDIPELQFAMNELSAAFKRVKDASKDGTPDELIQANKEYELALKAVKAQLDINTRAEKEASAAQKLKDDRVALQSKIDAWLTKNSAAANKFGSQLRKLRAQAENCDRATLDHLEREFKQIDKAAEAAGVRMQTFGDRLKTQFQKYSSYLSVASVIMYATQALRDMFEQVKLIDSAMTELKKVTNETDESYNQFLSNAAKRAKELGTTIDGLVASTADFARLGYGFKDAQGLAEVANIYAVVGDEIESVEDATQSLISTLAAFKKEMNGMDNSEFAMSIVDKMNEVANNYAISSGGLGQALQRSASSMAAANNSLDETIAMITAANEVAQNPEKVGNALKTISMRIRGAKTELEEAGESTDDMAESTASLRQEIKALSGIDIMLDSKTFKSTYQIMDELSTKWEDLSDIAQASITELLAGKHQGNIMASLMTNFDTARAALETSLTSSGSAMAEHEKWSKSLEAQLLKLKAAWQSLSQSFLQSDFLKAALDVVIGLVNGLDKLISTLGAIPTLIASFASFKGISAIVSVINKGGGLKELGGILGVLKNAFPNVTKTVKKLVASLREMSFASGGAGSAFHGFLSLILQHPYIAAAAVAVTVLTAAFVHQKKKAEELEKEVDELTSKFKEQHAELTRNKSSFKSEATRYAQLSKGVDQLGRNVSLTADEYSEYQSVVNSIADQIPSLVAGYDSQGNAILSVKGNVDELIESYEDLIKAENDALLGKAKKVQDNFKNIVDNVNSSDDGLFGVKLSSKAAKAYKEMFDSKDSDDFFVNAQSNSEYWDSGIRLMGKDIKAMADLLEENGIERQGNWLHPELDADFVKRAFKENKNIVSRILDDFYADLEEETEGMKSLAQAAISNAFDLSDSDFYGMNDTLKDVAKQVVNGLDYDFFAKLTEDGQSVEEYVNNMLESLNKLSSGDISQIDTAFSLRTKFNNGDISYGEFIHGLENAGKLIDTLNIADDIKAQLKLSLGLNEDNLVEEYETLLNRLTTTSKDSISKGNIIGLGVEDAKKFIDSLSSEELSVITNIIPELDANATIEQIQAAIDREMAVMGFLFDLNLEVETASIDAFNTALKESASAAGLSSDSIAALKGRYADLESKGYNLSDMFEETSNGIHLNRKAVRELEKAYAEQKQNDIKEDVSALKKEYDLLTQDIENCNDASERASLYVQRDAVIKQINDAATLAAQYEGLTSAYNDWLAAEESGQERDMYENIIKGFETVDDEISRGWLDDGTIEFLELLTGKDLTTAPIEDLKQAYKDLDKEIGKSGYSIRDFFTVNEDGDSTNTGVYNFLETIESLGGKFKDVINKKDGRIVGFDFKVAGGDEAIAQALGISEELVEIMLRAADDAGFVVNLEGAWTQLADLKTEAESARDKLIDLKKNGLDKLKDFDVNFDLNADGKDLLAEQEKAVNLLEKFKKNGKIDLAMDGAQQALDIAEYLTIRLDDLTEPRYMQVDTSILDDNLQEPIEKMQEFERLSKEKHLLSLTGDTKGLEEVDAEMDNIVQYLDSIEDKEVKAKLGIEGLSEEEIKEKLEKGEIELAAELNLDVQMSDDLKDIRLLMMGQLGIADKNEIKLKVGYDIDDSVVGSLTEDEKEVVVKYIAENEEEFKKLTKEEQEAVVKLVADGTDIESWEAEEKEAIVKYVVDNGEIEGWTPEQKLAFAKYLVDGGDVEGWSPEAKEAFVKYLVDGGDPEKFDPEDKDSWVIYHADTTEPDNAQSQFTDKEVTWTVRVKTFADKVWNLFKGNGWVSSDESDYASGANGTANVNGTAGRAFKQGSWGTKNSGTALVGELGRETLVRDGRYYTIGDTGAEFIKYRKGDIIFNHRQTEELFANGRVTSGGGRAKAFASGTAFVAGSSGRGGFGKVAAGIAAGAAEAAKKAAEAAKAAKDVAEDAASSGSDGALDKNENGVAVGGDKDGSKFEESFDWIEIAISRVEREIENLDQIASSVYKSWSDRNIALSQEIGLVGKEISTQEAAYNKYIKKAESIGLDERYAKMVREGAINIGDLNGKDFVGEEGEALVKKIKDYQTWYEKAINCKDAIEKLRIDEYKLYQQRFDNVKSQYDGILQGFEHTGTMLDEYVSQSEENGYIVSRKYYEALRKNEESKVLELKKEQSALISERNKAEQDGLSKTSQAWYDMCAEIDSVTQSIEEGETSLISYANAIRDIDWEIFDLIQGRISDVTDEANFLIELMSNDKLFDENGALTKQGEATIGLHGQNYNTYMYQAGEYGAQVDILNSQIAKDKSNQTLINRRNELIKLQRDSILAAEQEKIAIKDLVSEGIELELDALQERIDLHNEELDSMKDLYDYQKRVEESSKNIASLRKQLSSYEGDDSEEAKAKIQELRVSLEEAEENLRETEYDRYISDQQQLLGSLFEEYESILNTRLDDIDTLIRNQISAVNDSASAIKDTLTAEAKNVGTDLSEAMKGIWNGDGDSIKSVLSNNNASIIGNEPTTLRSILDGIKLNVDAMVDDVDKNASKKVNSNKTSPSTKKDPTVNNTGSQSSGTGSKGSVTPTIKVGGKIDAGNAPIYDYAGDKSGERQYFRKDPIYKVLGEKNGYLKVLWHKLSSGVTGWFKKSDVKALATGAKKIDANDMAWTQEKGNEYIVRPSDGAILTPVAKGDSVLNATASSNIWNMANYPAEFIRDNLKLSATSAPSNSNVQSNYTQHLDNVVFSFPNVKNYDDMLSAMQKDKNFERLILSMSIDRVAGKTSLAKGKSIR